MSPLAEAGVHAFAFGEVNQDFQPRLTATHSACASRELRLSNAIHAKFAHHITRANAFLARPTFSPRAR